MENEQRTESNGKKQEREPQQGGRCTQTVIAIQVFILFFFLLWFVVPKYVNPGEVGTVFFQSVFSVALVIVVIVQTRIYHQQATILNAQLSTQRAFLMIDGGDIPALKEGEKGKMYIVFKNSGNTPANNVKIRAHAEMRNTIPTMRELPDLVKTQHSGACAPQQTLHSTVETKLNLTAEQIAEIDQSGKPNLIAWGIVTYWDAFRQERHTKFCVCKKRGLLAFGPVGEENEAD